MGPLTGIRVLEIASMAPGPFCCMVLADLGADVLRVDRTGAGPGLTRTPGSPLDRGRRSVAADLKAPGAADLVLRLAGAADVLVEGFRPGVAERLGIGPEAALARNPRLVYGRMTGWGQQGPRASQAGHDINYIALSGALHPIGPADRPPVPPINYLGDFGGGGLVLAMGILAALVERERSGQGQVIDAAMVDGAALISSFLYGLRSAGMWSDVRGSNLLDGAAPFYDTYATGDGRFVAVGALEPRFYAALLDGLGLAGADLPAQYDRHGWPVLRERFTAAFASRTREEWERTFAGTDACVAPVLSPAEAADHPDNAAREVFVEVGGVVQPAPAPRFGRTPTKVPAAPPVPGADADAVLAEWGFSGAEIGELRASGTVA